jgi:hypothetical protein
VEKKRNLTSIGLKSVGKIANERSSGKLPRQSNANGRESHSDVLLDQEHGEEDEKLSSFDSEACHEVENDGEYQWHLKQRQ